MYAHLCYYDDAIRSSSGGSALRYAHPVVWMTSFGRNGPYGVAWPAWCTSRQLRARPGRSLMSMNACLETVTRSFHFTFCCLVAFCQLHIKRICYVMLCYVSWRAITAIRVIQPIDYVVKLILYITMSYFAICCGLNSLRGYRLRVFQVTNWNSCFHHMINCSWFTMNTKQHRKALWHHIG